jgi:hypothetical protein
MDMDHGAEVGGQGIGGKPGEGFVHYRDGPDLLLRELIGPLKVVYLDFPGIRGGLKILRLGFPGVDSAEQLVYFVLGQNFGHFSAPI